MHSAWSAVFAAQVDYDEWDGEVPLELRMGLDAAVEIAIADDPPRAPKDFLLNLQSLLSHEVQGLKRVLAEQLQPGRERDRAQTKRKSRDLEYAHNLILSIGSFPGIVSIWQCAVENM